MSDEELVKLSETDWLTAADPYLLLDLLRARTRNRVDRRRLHLFSCACCRELWHLLADERSRRGIDIAERHADGLATDAELNAAHAAAHAVALLQRKDPLKDATWAVSFADRSWQAARFRALFIFLGFFRIYLAFPENVGSMHLVFLPLAAVPSSVLKGMD